MLFISNILKYNKYTINNIIYFEYVMGNIPLFSSRKDGVRFLMAKMSHKSRNWGKGKVLLLLPRQRQWQRSVASQNPETCDKQAAGLHV